MAVPVVVKIGGSLHDHIDPLIAVLRHAGRPVLIVPGGGICARFIQDLGMEGDAAHWMAICAMEQFGWFIAARGVTPVRELFPPRELTVLLPYVPLIQADPLPHTWQVTSDTIAAWVASSLGLGLVVLKSVDGIRKDGILQERLREAVSTDVVDSSFIPYVLSNKVHTVVINGRHPRRLEDCLREDRVTGTTIGF